MDFILKNASVITMDDGRILRNTDVFVSKGKIARIAANIAPFGMKTYDCTGKFLIPGLIDSHVHMDSNEITEMLLACGITACRNMWGFPETQQWIQEINEGKRFGPRVYSTGPLTDGRTYWPGSAIVSTPEEAEAAVISCLAGGYQYFKTYPDIPREAFLHLMKVASNFGLKVVGHGNNFVTPKELVDSGYYSLEHIGYLPSNDEEVIMMAESGLWLCPTFIVSRAIEDYVKYDNDVRETKHYDAMSSYWQRDWDKMNLWRKGQNRYQHMDFDAQRKRADLFARHSDNILLGTDVPNSGVTGGFSVYEELLLMSEGLNMGHYATLRTATVNAARSLGISGQKGRLLEGMDADILVLESDPLLDLANAESFVAVIKEGHYYTKQECDEVLEQVRHYTDDDICPLM